MKKAISLFLAVLLISSLFSVLSLDTFAANEVRVGHASSSCGNTTAGDQSGNEVCTGNWYYNSRRPWQYVIRAKDSTVAEKLAVAMEQACANNNIGYNQDGRTSLYKEAKKNKWNLSKITALCNTDCSALVAVCVNAAGIEVSSSMYTGNEKTILEKTGKFDIFTSPSYTQSSDNLKRGDILLYHSSTGDGHTLIVLSNGKSVNSNSSSYPVVKLNDTGDKVRLVQAMLNRANQAALGVDGIFGSVTLSAVKAFQTKMSIGADGIVGMVTWKKLFTKAALSKGCKGFDVKMLQRMLNALSNANLGVDGDFGPLTENAVKAFQSKNGLGADGIVGLYTWSKLFELYYK